MSLERLSLAWRQGQLLEHTTLERTNTQLKALLLPSRNPYQLLNNGTCICILHWALQIMEQALPGVGTRHWTKQRGQQEGQVPAFMELPSHQG